VRSRSVRNGTECASARARADGARHEGLTLVALVIARVALGAVLYRIAAGEASPFLATVRSALDPARVCHVIDARRGGGANSVDTIEVGRAVFVDLAVQATLPLEALIVAAGSWRASGANS